MEIQSTGNAKAEEPEAAAPERGRLSLRFRAMTATGAILLVLAAGAAGYYPSPRLDEVSGEGTRVPELVPDPRSIAARLSAGALSSASPAEARAAVRELAAAAHAVGADPAPLLAGCFPTAAELLAMLARDRDLRIFTESAEAEGPAGEHYARSAAEVGRRRPLRAVVESLFAEAHAVLSDPGGGTRLEDSAASRAPLRIAAKGEIGRPRKRDMERSHTYALDLFFANSTWNGAEERGPAILALSPGIVVASAQDWEGGAGIESWVRGGLSPAAGNGLVVYDPALRRYHSYFHMSEVEKSPGDLVEAGEALGRGGNTGFAARTKGHGGHVHVEIFDAARDGPLRYDEILALILF